MISQITSKALISQVRNAIEKGIKTKINCGNYLYVYVSSSGTATWNIRVRSKGKDTTKALGPYQSMSLKEARIAALSYSDAAEETELKSITPLFSDYSANWLASFLPNPNAAKSHKNDKRYLNLRSQIRHLKGLGKLHLDEITPIQVDGVLSKADCSQCAKYLSIRALNQLLNSAVIDGIIEKNPCASMLNAHGTISVKYARPKIRGFAWVPPAELGSKFFNPLKSQPVINLVFYLLDAFTALRLTSCISLEWDWIHDGRIMVPGEYMKMGKDFNVPVTPYIKALLANWKATCSSNGVKSKFVFPSRSDLAKPKRLQDVQVPVADATRGEMTIHGLRKSFRTWAAEYMVSSDVAEMALAHAPKNQLIATYNKYNYFRERHEALCLWNEYLCRMLPDQFLNLIQGIDPEQRSIFQKIIEGKEKVFLKKNLMIS